MRPNQLGESLRRVAGQPPVAASVSDRELLQEFAAGNQPTAFRDLVERHSAMVFGVCKRVAGDHHAAEDAFQATFLVLAKKAAAGGWHDSIANWLHATAYRTAMRARAQVARGRRNESGSEPPRAVPSAADEAGWSDLRAIVDEEVMAMPEKLRLPVLLCVLHDRTLEEAADTLRLPATTVKSRLQQGRDRLRDRLGRRGVGIGTGVIGALTAGGSVPAAVTASTLEQATGGAATGFVGTLVNEELRMAFARKLRLGIAVAGAGFVMAWGGFQMLPGSAAPTPPKPWKDTQRAASIGLPKASAPVVEKELEVTVQPTKSVFAPDETPILDVLFAHAPAEPLKGVRSDPIYFMHPVGEVAWEITPVGGPGPWVPTKQEFRRRVMTLEMVFSSADGRIEVAKSSVLSGPFHYAGTVEKPMKPIEFLPPGRYSAVGTFTLSDNRGRNEANGLKLWTGKVTTKPVEFVIGETPPEPSRNPLIVTAESKGKTVTAKVGQVVIVQLENPTKGAGWEGGTSPDELAKGPRVFRPTSGTSLNPPTPTIGTYRYEYLAKKPGEVVLDFQLLTPSAPWPVVRNATGKLDEFRVTITVEK